MLLALKRILLFPVHSLLDSTNVRSITLSRYWLMTSIGTLILSGFFSVVIVFARVPLIGEWLFDPLFAKRGLVIHVDLALLIWLYAFLCGLYVLLPSAGKSNRLLPMGYSLAITGLMLIIFTLFVPSAEPILSNYIPMLNHPLFVSGLTLFAAGVGCTVLNGRLLPSGRPDAPVDPRNRPLFPASSIPGFRSAGLLLLVSFVTFFGSWLGTSTGLDSETYFELIIWGGGHILQFVNIAAMLAVWIILLGKLLNRNPLSYRWSALLFGLFTLPVLGAPLLTMNGTSDILYNWGFTRYMQWGIFPVVTIFISIVSYKLIRGRINHELPTGLLKNPYFGGLVTSMLLTVIGFILGAMIRGSNTMIPAHYHAAVGGITVAFMAVTYLLLEIHGIRLPGARIKRWASIQPMLFGLGQAVFAAGFGYAGAHGLARKSFGVEQQIESVEMYAGLGFMAIGGILAMAGGLLFLWIVFKAWRNHKLTNL